MTPEELNKIDIEVLYKLKGCYDEKQYNILTMYDTPEMRKYREAVTPQIMEIISNGYILEMVND